MAARHAPSGCGTTRLGAAGLLGHARPATLYALETEGFHFGSEGLVLSRGAESESELPGVLATSQELDLGLIKLPRLRPQNVLFESVI